MKVCVWTTVLVCMLSTAVRGDDESDRKQYIDEIDRLLDGMADDLSRVLGDSGPGYVDYATKKADELKDKLSRLSNVKGSDDKAKRYVDYYGRYADSFKEYAKYLRMLKEGQKALDAVPRYCEDNTKELLAKIRGYTDSNDPRGMDEVPKLAREYGRKGKDAIEQAERKRYEMYQWYDRSDDFSESDGKWSNVRTNLAYAGRGLWDYFSPKYEQVKRDDVCGNLAKEEKNPLVEQEMKKLFEGKKGIETIYAAMDSQLSEIASNLNDLEGDNSTSDIDAADRKADELARNVEQLDRIRGQDGEARRRVELYRSILRAYGEASKHLRILKQSQFVVDRAPEKCGEADRNLSDFIRKYTERGDTAGLKLIPAKARALSEPIKAALSKADEQHRVMDKERNESLRFDPSEGRWREVTSNMKDSTNAIWDYWRRAWETSHKECDELAKGEQNKVVVRALNDLGSISSKAESDLRKLRSDHRKWYDELKELREWYKQDTQNVREAFCAIEESPGDTEVGPAYAAQLAQIADRMRDRIAPKWNDLASRGAAMIASAKELQKVQDEDVSKSASATLDDVTKTMNSVENILRGELNGSNNPRIRARIELGKNEHSRIQADEGKCDKGATEITLPNGKRIDCVQANSGVCTIYEIKPNNDRAKSKGRDQAGGYRRDVLDLFNGTNKDKRQEAFKGDRAVFLKCVDINDQLRVEIGVRAYDYCPDDGKLFNDFVVP